MQHGFKETGGNEVQVCSHGGLFGEQIGHLFLRDQLRRGASMKIEMLIWKEVEEIQGHMALTFSVKSPLDGEGDWVPQAGPEDLEQPLEEFMGRLQNMNKRTRELQISTGFLESSLASRNKSHKSVSGL